MMPTKLKRFQTNIQNGMGLEEALIKHGLTFKEAVTTMPRPRRRKPRLLTGDRDYYPLILLESEK